MRSLRNVFNRWRITSSWNAHPASRYNKPNNNNMMKGRTDVLEHLKY